MKNLTTKTETAGLKTDVIFNGNRYPTTIKGVGSLGIMDGKEEIIVYVNTPKEILDEFGIDDIEIFATVNEDNEFMFHCHSDSVMDGAGDEEFYDNTTYWREFIDIQSAEGECPFGFTISLFDLLNE